MSSRALILIFLFSVAQPIAAEPASRPQPTAVVEILHAALIHAMGSGESYQWRVNYLSDSIHANFDFTTIARISLGRNWRALSDAQRRDLEKLISDLVISTYAGRFKHYKGEKFATLSTQTVKSNRVQVRSRLITSAGEQVDLVYQLHEIAGGWYIFDIVANGVSDLSLKRAAYGAIYQAEGLAGIIEAINNNINRNDLDE